ncbi:MAG: hypothetical protein ABFD84_11930 [Candidatus Polarisedimenticolia bacterium]
MADGADPVPAHDADDALGTREAEQAVPAPPRRREPFQRVPGARGEARDEPRGPRLRLVRVEVPHRQPQGGERAAHEILRAGPHHLAAAEAEVAAHEHDGADAVVLGREQPGHLLLAGDLDDRRALDLGQDDVERAPRDQADLDGVVEQELHHEEPVLPRLRRQPGERRLEAGEVADGRPRDLPRPPVRRDALQLPRVLLERRRAQAALALRPGEELRDQVGERQRGLRHGP